MTKHRKRQPFFTSAETKAMLEATRRELERARQRASVEERTMQESQPKVTAEQLAWVFKKLDEFIHERGGGTYRALLYDTLGFGPDAYSVCYPYGLNLTNFIHDALAKGATGESE